MRRAKFMGLLGASPLGFMVPKGEERKVKAGDVVLMSNPPHSDWYHIRHVGKNPGSMSFDRFTPQDADLAEGFWVDYAWHDSVRGNRGHLQWLDPDAPGGYNTL